MLKNVKADLSARNWVCGYAEASTDAGTSLQDLVLDLERALPPRGAWKRLTQRIAGVSLSTGPAGLGVNLKDAPEETIYSELRALLSRLVELTYPDGTGVAVLIDEAQVLNDHIFVILRAVKSLEELPILLMFAGLPVLPEITGNSQRSNPHIYYYELDRLQSADAESSLIAPLEASDGQITPAALEILLGWASGHPLALQMLGATAWEEAYEEGGSDAPVVIDRQHAQVSVGETRSSFERGYYRPYWADMSEGERLLIKSCTGGKKPFPRIDESAYDVGDALVKLLAKGLLTAYDDETFAIALPGFAEFVMRQP